MIAAGGPAGNTRVTLFGTVMLRPVASCTVPAALARDAASVATSPPVNARRSSCILIDRHHHIRCLDDGIGFLPLGKLERIDGFIGDGRRDDLSSNVDFHMRGGGALGDLDALALDDVAGADLHFGSPCASPGAENPCRASICCPLAETMNRAKRQAADGLSFMT